jgi:magnesium-transporting ATPase (P-type)
MVRPGAGIAADGIVVEGTSELNESMVTGESRPVRKAPGDKLIAGTVNGAGSLRVCSAVRERQCLVLGLPYCSRRLSRRSLFRWSWRDSSLTV